MRKKFIKKLTGMIVAASVFTMLGATVFAAPSPAANGVVKEVASATDANGNAISATIGEIPAEKQALVTEIKNIDKVKELLGAEFVEGMEVADVKEVTVPEGTAFPATLTFNVPGVAANTKVAVLHHDGTKWEKVACQAGAGTITATFNSLSPVAFVVDKNTATGASAGQAGQKGAASPKTGQNVAVAGVILAIAATGACVFYKKKEAVR